MSVSQSSSSVTFNESGNSVIEGNQVNVVLKGNVTFNSGIVGTPKEGTQTNLAVLGDATIVEQTVVGRAVEEVNRLTLRDLGDILRHKYEDFNDIPTNEWFWPPLCRSQYITLAMVSSHHCLQDDYFTHKSLHKQPADDLPYNKREASFNEIFPEYEDGGFSTLISGRPGIGKTVLLTKVCKDWGRGDCLKNIEVVIHVSLRELHGKSPKPTLLDMLKLHLTDPEKNRKFCQLIEATNGKNVCFAFDGLDEYPLLNTFNDIVTEIIGKQKLFNASVIVTSRPTTSHLVKQKMKKHAEIIGFMPEQIKSYIEGYYTATPVEGRELIAYLENHPNVKDMCFLPLHLAMIVHLNDVTRSSLPETESEIYHRFVSHSIIRCILRERKVEDPEVYIETFAQMKDYLSEEEYKHFETTCHIAFHSRVQSRIIFNTQDIQNKDKFNCQLPQNQLKQFKKDIFGIISSYSICTEHGVTRYYSFQHLTFQEFLAAYYISQLEESEQFHLLDELGKKPEMKEVWKFYFGIIKFRPNLIPLFDKISAQHTSHGSDTLFLSTCVFEAQNEELCKRLVMSREKKLNINNVILSAPDCSAIGFVLRHTCEIITDLMMNYCQVGENEFHALKRQIDDCSDFQKLKNFQIRSQLNPLKQEGARDLLSVLSKMSKLTELRLYGNQLETEKLKRISLAIKTMNHLQILVLTKNNLGPACGREISDLLENYPNLIQFYASYNPLTTEGLQKLSPGLLKCKKLRRLGLRGCQLDENAGTILSEILSTLSALEQLELYWNMLKDNGVSDLCKSLQEAPKLQQVSFTKNEIRDEGGCLLAQAVGESKSIQQIRLFYNDISSKTRLAFYNVTTKTSRNFEYAL